MRGSFETGDRSRGLYNGACYSLPPSLSCFNFVVSCFDLEEQLREYKVNASFTLLLQRDSVSWDRFLKIGCSIDQGLPTFSSVATQAGTVNLINILQ